jgi:hypothetical protein
MTLKHGGEGEWHAPSVESGISGETGPDVDMGRTRGAFYPISISRQPVAIGAW